MTESDVGFQMKMEVRHPHFFYLWTKYKSEATGRHLKLKKPAQLQEVLDISRTLLNEVESGQAGLELEEKRGKLEQVLFPFLLGFAVLFFLSTLSSN